MDLFENPFYLLGVNARDTRQTIVKVCDIKSLEIDPEVCRNARTILITPRSRLAAEIAWFPGISPARALELIQKLKSAPQEVVNSLDGLEPLIRCNVAAGILATTDFRDYPDNLAKLILYLSRAFEEVEENSIIDLINEDREVSRFPVIQDVSTISEEMGKRRRYLITVMEKALNEISSPDVIMTRIVKEATSTGEDQSPILIEELTDQYQIKVRKELDQVTQQIQSAISNIKSNSSEGLTSGIDLLEKQLRIYDQKSEPMQIIMQSKGMDDEYTLSIARDVRGLSVHLANEKGLYHEACRLTQLMLEIFKELPRFSEQLASDKVALEGIIASNKERIPCSDGNCIGTINENGVCGICGRPLRDTGAERVDFPEGGKEKPKKGVGKKVMIALGIIGVILYFAMSNRDEPSAPQSPPIWKERAPTTSPAPASSRSYKRERVEYLKADITTNKGKLSLMESELSKLDGEIKKIDRKIKGLKSEIDKQENMGIDSSDLVSEHNGYIPIFNEKVQEFKSLYPVYEKLLTETNAMVAEHNNLIRK